MSFNALSGRGNYAYSGTVAANDALRSFIAQRKKSPDYGRLVQEAEAIRSREKIAAIKAEADVAEVRVRTNAAVEAKKILSDAEAAKKKDQRKAGLLAAAGQRVGLGMMKYGEEPLKRRDSSSVIDRLDERIKEYRRKGSEITNETPTESSTIDNTPNVSSSSPGKVSEATTIAITPNVAPKIISPAIPPSNVKPKVSKPSDISLMPYSNLDRMRLNIIGKYESDPVGGYNAINQIGTNDGRGVQGYSGDIRKMSQHGGRPLTDFTVGEILQLQSDPGSSMSNDQWIAQGKLHAVGRYQFIGPTFKSEVQRQGIDINSKFTPKLQDQMALSYFNHVGSGSPWIGPLDKATGEERRILNLPN